jgi:hypothetical protein
MHRLGGFFGLLGCSGAIPTSRTQTRAIARYEMTAASAVIITIIVITITTGRMTKMMSRNASSRWAS